MFVCGWGQVIIDCFGFLKWTWFVIYLEYLASTLADRMACCVFPQFVQRAVCRAVQYSTVHSFSIEDVRNFNVPVVARTQVVRLLANETK